MKFERNSMNTLDDKNMGNTDMGNTDMDNTQIDNAKILAGRMTNAKMLIISLFVMAVILALAGCASTSIETGNIKIVTTTGMIEDITKNVGGEFVEVKSLMGSGVDPHLYKASAGDVTILSDANMIFYNGLHLEAQMGEVIERMGESKKVVAVSDKIPRVELLDFIGFPGQYDPHVWFDVTYWIKATEQVRDTMKEYDAAHADIYEQNAAAYITKLEELHASVQQKASSLSEDQRVLITAHDAFNYFGRRYGFEVRGLQGISTQAEAGTRDVQDLVAFIVERKIKAVFVETSVSERNIRAVQEAVKAKGWDLKIGGRLYSDAMGDKGTFEGTYVGMVTHNIDTIVGALK